MKAARIALVAVLILSFASISFAYKGGGGAVVEGYGFGGIEEDSEYDY